MRLPLGGRMPRGGANAPREARPVSRCPDAARMQRDRACARIGAPSRLRGRARPGQGTVRHPG